jgi:hypothetical protein
MELNIRRRSGRSVYVQERVYLGIKDLEHKLDSKSNN